MCGLDGEYVCNCCPIVTVLCKTLFGAVGRQLADNIILSLAKSGISKGGRVAGTNRWREWMAWPHRQVWGIALPLMLSNVSVPLLGLVDTAVMGHLDSEVYLAAVSLGSMLFMLLFWSFGFLRMGTSGQTAQAFGADNGVKIQQSLIIGLRLAGVITLVLWTLQTPLAQISFDFFQGPREVEALARDYYDIRIWGAPASLMNYVFLGWFIGLHRGRYPLYLLVFTNSMNIVLDLLFVVGFEWGIIGVAWASVMAEYSGLMLSLVLSRRLLKRYCHHTNGSTAIDLNTVLNHLKVNFDIFLRTLCLVISFAYFTNQGAKQGELILAVNAVLLNFQLFMAHALDGLANAAEALVGQAKGMKNAVRFWRVVKTCALWSLLVALGFVAVYWGFGEVIVRLLTTLPDVVRWCDEYLVWVIVLPIVSVWSFLFDGVFIGSMWSREMRNTMLLSTVGFVLCVELSSAWGNHGLWFSLLVFMALRGGFMGWVLWYKQKVVLA